jgi:hypothetical protein
MSPFIQQRWKRCTECVCQPIHIVDGHISLAPLD